MKDIDEERKIYRRWRYDPVTDEAFLDSKDGDIRGYAIRLDGGWRLTNMDHDTVDDLYITRKVMQALRGATRQASITPHDFHFNQLHYGKPLPR